MSGSKRNRTTLELGHDAFLDIVANLVGILIILVVVLGTQSTQVIKEIESNEADELMTNDGTIAASDGQMETLAQFAMRAASAQSDSERLESTIRDYDREIAEREKQRAVMLDYLSEAKAAWENEKEKFDEQARVLAEQQSEFEQVSEQLATLEGERERLQGEKKPVVAVAHLPTPMAKTVFGDEIHFRLKDNRLSVVPIESLLREIRSDFQHAANGSRQGVLNSAVGPVRGYVARYAMSKEHQVMNQNGRVGMGVRIQLVGMSVEPLEEPHGSPIKALLIDGKELDIELAQRDPATTTITVWVYPDSFASFRLLKEYLYSKGFAAAARPLPMGQKITGSPRGSRSVAQ